MSARLGYGRGCKPISLQHEEPREVIWKAIREMKQFTIQGLVSKANKAWVGRIRSTTVRSFINRLESADIVRVIDRSKVSNVAVKKTYGLINDVGPECPSIRSDGTLIQGSVNENMWRTMWIMGVFTVEELAISATTEEISVAITTAKCYCLALQRAGYLVHNLKRNRTYRTIPCRYTGPKPPAIQRVKSVYDHNLKRVVWPEKLADGSAL